MITEKNTTIWAIDYLKVIFASFVVLIHANYLNENILFDKIFRVIVFDITVPFFFVCSGYFLGKNILKKNEVEKSIKFTFLKLFKIYVIFGSWYFLLDLIKLHFLNKINLWEAIRELLHRLIVQSPGGGLWYVYSVLIGLGLLGGGYKLCGRKVFELLFIISIITYILGIIMFNSHYINSDVLDNYKSCFYDNRNIIFFGVYYFGGIHLALKSGRFKMKHLRLKGSIIGATYIISGLLSIFFQNFNIYFAFSVIKVLCVYCLLIFSINISTLIEINSKRIREVSTAIYFIHYTFVYVFLFANKYFNIRNKESAIFCMITTIVFALILTSKRLEKVYSLLFC